MTNQPPLNPDALKDVAHERYEARRSFEGLPPWEDLLERNRKAEIRALENTVSAYLAVAQPVVTGEQVNLAGWTCDGIHEPGSYATCEDCRGACDDLANFYNNMMQQPKADGPWTGRPEVKP